MLTLVNPDIFMKEGKVTAIKKLLDITDFSREELRELLNLVAFIRDNQEPYKKECEGRTVVTAFFDGDRNSQLAFKTAAVRMGGTCFDFVHQNGESLKDEVVAMSAVGDVLVLNHPKKGAARAASLYSRIPVINAGDGNRAFPVKTISDFASVWSYKKHISNMKIGFLGDFSDNAPVKNLLQCLNLYNGNEFYFVSVNGEPVSDDYVNIMDRREKPFTVYDNLYDILPELDVLYMTEVKKSSFKTPIMYEARKHNFVLDERLLMTAKSELIVLHNLPRGEELDISCDDDERVKCFDQMNNLVYSSMAAVIKTIANRTGRLIKPDFEESTHDFRCGCDDCITSTEKYLPDLFYELKDGTLVCKYCGHRFKKAEETE